MKQNEDTWIRVLHARDSLVKLFLKHPEVSLIDIGYETETEDETHRYVLRVHVRSLEAVEMMGIPDEIDGIPVRVITVPGGYRIGE